MERSARKGGHGDVESGTSGRTTASPQLPFGSLQRAGPLLWVLPVALVSFFAALTVFGGGGGGGRWAGGEGNRTSVVAQLHTHLTSVVTGANASLVAELMESQRRTEAMVEAMLQRSNAANGKPKHMSGGALYLQFPYHLYERRPCITERFPDRDNYWFHGKAWDHEGGAILHGTVQAQRIIHEHQHPPNCTDVKFLVHTTHGSGIGSQVHMYGAALATAMALGRVYVEVYNDAVLYTRGGKYCGEHERFDQCFFHPFSSCTPEDAGITADTSVDEPPSHIPVWENDEKYEKEQKDAKTIVIKREDWGGLGGMRTVPPQFAQMLRHFDMIPESWWFRWWRAQASAYTVRLNPKMRQNMAARQAEIFTNKTIQPGTISVHVRHGDKESEAQPVPESVYWDRILRLKETDPRLRKSIFLITYDPNVLRWFQDRCEADGWELLYTDFDRMDDQEGLWTSEYAERLGPSTEAMNAFVGLNLALQCDAWVGTQSSNWGRLIDELRATTGCAADKIYMDAAMGDPPGDTDMMKP